MYERVCMCVCRVCVFGSCVCKHVKEPFVIFDNAKVRSFFYTIME